ncbi:CYTH-like domain superfamily [Sesbania bispinosa]|nr:CYTH-like domain superfamily [Sesbania bispinosa]
MKAQKRLEKFKPHVLVPIYAILIHCCSQTSNLKRLPMEVEIKLRLPDSATHQKLSNLLSPFHTKTLIQENIFFDGKNAELTSNLVVLRIRFYNLENCVLSLKAKPVISGGISRMEEHEEPFDPCTWSCMHCRAMETLIR